MKFNVQTTLLVIIALLLGLLIYQIRNVNTNIVENNKRIDSIQVGIDSIYTVNDTINSQIKIRENKDKELNETISVLNKNLNTTKKQTNEKINSVDKFTYSDLNNFFEDRYKTGHDSTTKSVNR